MSVHPTLSDCDKAQLDYSNALHAVKAAVSGNWQLANLIDSATCAAYLLGKLEAETQAQRLEWERARHDDCDADMRESSR